jgi:preprotein translocase SecE subunit
MASIGDYLRETQGELRHVAWPTRLQTIVYTILVALISVGVAAYLGFFDYLFTSGLSRFVQALPAANPIQVTQIATGTTSTLPAPSTRATQATSTDNGSGPKFQL